MEQNVTYTFGPFRLETVTQLLWYDGSSVGLQPKVYHLLLYFLQHPGRIISREELFNAIWKGTIVEDSALRRAVNSLRKTLHDESKPQCYILTASKSGYRFLPEVTLECAVQGSDATAQAMGLHYLPKTEFPDVSQEHDVELAQLLEAFEEAADGKRRLVFLNGEQGIGKTALIGSFLAKIRHPEFVVLRARCVRLDGAVEPFLPLLEALELRCREPCGRSLINCLHQIAPTWLYQMLNVLEPKEIATLQPKVLHINSGRMLREGADFFEKLGTESTLVLILDNSHWSDQFTLDLLNFLIFRCSATRLLMIVSYRPNESGDGAQRLEEMREEVCRRGLCKELFLHNGCTAVN